jgi:hypothetical protein
MMMAFLLAAAAVLTPGQCSILKGGPGEGMCFDPIERSDTGDQLFGLRPAPNAGPPLGEELGKVINLLLIAQERHGTLPTTLIAKGATQQFCPEILKCSADQPLKRWPLDRSYSHNAPYLLTDGRVRIEWMKGSRLVYLSFITLNGLHVIDIQTGRAKMLYKPGP